MCGDGSVCIDRLTSAWAGWAWGHTLPGGGLHGLFMRQQAHAVSHDTGSGPQDRTSRPVAPMLRCSPAYLGYRHHHLAQAAGALPSTSSSGRSSFDWEGDRPLNLPMESLVIYEAHVRGFTAHPTSGVAAPGA